MQLNSYKIDFGKNLQGNSWEVVNDGVMGGLSTSTLSLKENYLVFEGKTSLQNNGGFASIRSQNLSLQLANYKTVEIRYKTSSNRTFGLRLALYNRFYMPNLKYNFSSSKGEWKTLEIPVTDFKVYRMGNLISDDVPIKKMKDVIRVGIIVADKKEGPFEIEIDYITFNP